MLVKTESNLESLRRAGKAAARALHAALAYVKEGITTATLDAIAAGSLKSQGARSAASLIFDFPGSICTSVNNEAAHGLPGNRILAAGDIINLDLTAELGGYYADCGLSVVVEPAGNLQRRLADAARDVLAIALGQVRNGVAARTVGALIEREAAARGFVTITDLCGHGTGRAPHESPDYLECYDNPANTTIFKTGMVVAIEVFLSTTDRTTGLGQDNWTLLTNPGNLVAQAEHTILVTEGLPEILTLNT